jgi:hypothetical protein
MQSIRTTHDPAEMIQIALDLQRRLPQLGHDELFAGSIPQFVISAGYYFVIAEDDQSDEMCAVGSSPSIRRR